MKKYFFLALIALFSAGCRTNLNVSEVQFRKNIVIDSSFADNADIAATIQPYKEELEKNMSTVIAHTQAALTKSGDNSPLGNLLADFTYEGGCIWAKTHGLPQPDAAVINIGGIRKIIDAGNILVKDVYEVMPFENEIVIVKMDGAAMQGLFDYYAKYQKNNPVSHLFIDSENHVLKKTLIDGKPLEMNKIYYVVTSDYLALGGDNMSFFSKGEIIGTGVKMRDLFMEKFKEIKEITPPTDIRLVFKP